MLSLRDIEEEIYQIIHGFSDGIHDMDSMDKEELSKRIEDEYGVDKWVIFDELNKHGDISESEGQDLEDTICEIVFTLCS